ncbi:hypothetical protein P4050_30655 [Pseudomonas aeruginosa]|nr:hypothetical protein [Pseudomonas aeruginosa]
MGILLLQDARTSSSRAREGSLGTEQSIDRATDQHWISITEETTTMSRHEDLLLQLIQREPDKIRSILGLPAPKPDLSWYEGADVWIEAGHRSDRGAELRIAFGSHSRMAMPISGYRSADRMAMR